MHSGGKEWGQAQACLAGHLQHRLAKDQDKMFGIFTGDLPVCAASPEVHYGSFSYLVFRSDAVLFRLLTLGWSEQSEVSAPSPRIPGMVASPSL